MSSHAKRAARHHKRMRRQTRARRRRNELEWRHLQHQVQAEPAAFNITTTELVPDFIYGWKRSRLVVTLDPSGPELRLLSRMQLISRLSDQATCAAGRTHQEGSPGADCRCGFYSHASRRAGPRLSYEFLLRVANSGTILAYTEGYRSGRQLVTNVYCPTKCSGHRRCMHRAVVLGVARHQASVTQLHEAVKQTFYELHAYCADHQRRLTAVYSLGDMSQLFGVAFDWIGA